jgi:hypothetical protein
LCARSDDTDEFDAHSNCVFPRSDDTYEIFQLELQKLTANERKQRALFRAGVHALILQTEKEREDKETERKAAAAEKE